MVVVGVGGAQGSVVVVVGRLVAGVVVGVVVPGAPVVGGGQGTVVVVGVGPATTRKAVALRAAPTGVVTVNRPRPTGVPAGTVRVIWFGLFTVNGVGTLP